MTAATFIASLVLMSMGLASIAVGLRGIVRKRAIIISARWILVVILIGFVPSVMFVSILSRTVGSFFPILILKLFVVLPLVIILWIQTRGYLLIGITSEMVGNGLRIALQELDIRFVETVSSIELTDHNGSLRVSVQDWMGTAHLFLQGISDAEIANRIREQVKISIENDEGITNLKGFIVHLVIGMLLIGFSILSFNIYRGLGAGT